MTPKWQYIDEISKYVDPKLRKSGNLFRCHVETFFSEERPLNFCLLEITTLLDATAIGEILVYSHLDDSVARRKLIKYQNIINSVKGKFKVSVPAYQDWYRKQTYMYVKNNPGAQFKRLPGDFFQWNFDGEKQIV